MVHYVHRDNIRQLQQCMGWTGVFHCVHRDNIRQLQQCMGWTGAFQLNGFHYLLNFCLPTGHIFTDDTFPMKELVILIKICNYLSVTSIQIQNIYHFYSISKHILDMPQLVHT